MNTEDLKTLLKKVPDSYEDFVIGISLAAKSDEDRDKIANYLQKHKNADTSDVIEFVTDEIKHIDRISE